jgi:hypothetical protein
VGPDADAEQLTQLTNQLRRELLLASGIDRVEPVREGMAPTGAKGDPITLAKLAITIAPVAIRGLVTLIQTWLSPHNQARITVHIGDDELTIVGDPSSKQKRMVDAFLRRHTPT